jgi:hypothetical protein
MKCELSIIATCQIPTILGGVCCSSRVVMLTSQFLTTKVKHKEVMGYELARGIAIFSKKPH